MGREMILPIEQQAPSSDVAVVTGSNAVVLVTVFFTLAYVFFFLLSFPHVGTNLTCLQRHMYQTPLPCPLLLDFALSIVVLSHINTVSTRSNHSKLEQQQAVIISKTADGVLI
jgi:hypothetical protein